MHKLTLIPTVMKKRPVYIDLINLLWQAVVSSLAENNLMVIIDSQLSSKPCFHGSGINPDLWVKGLTQLATMFSRVPNVVGMRLRNELRNVKDWYRYG